MEIFYLLFLLFLRLINCKHIYSLKTNNKTIGKHLNNLITIEGYPADEEIISSFVSDSENYPFMAFIVGFDFNYFDDTKWMSSTGYTAHGSGVILNTYWVLAPATVTAPYAPLGIDVNQSVNVHVGLRGRISTTDMLSNSIGLGYSPDYYFRRIHEVRYIILHKEFKQIRVASTHYVESIFDVSLVKVHNPFIYSRYIRPAPILRTQTTRYSDLETRDLINNKCFYLNYGCTFYSFGCEYDDLLKIPVYVYPYKNHPILGHSHRIIAYKPSNKIPSQYPTIKGGALICDGVVIGIGMCLNCSNVINYDFKFPNKPMGFTYIPKIMHFMDYTLGYNINFVDSRKMSLFDFTNSSSCVSTCIFLFVIFTFMNIVLL